MTTTANSAKFKGIVPISPGQFNSGMPLDTAKTQMLISNSDNLYFGANQVRVNVCLRERVQIGTATDPIGATRKRLIQTFGPFPLTVLKSGNPAPLYCEVLGAASKAASNATMYAVIRRSDEPPRVPSDTTDGLVYINYSSTTLSWASFSGEKLLKLPVSRVRSSAPFAGRLTTAGEIVNPEALWTCIDLWGSIPVVGSSDGLFFQGFFATELAFDAP